MSDRYIALIYDKTPPSHSPVSFIDRDTPAARRVIALLQKRNDPPGRVAVLVELDETASKDTP